MLIFNGFITLWINLRCVGTTSFSSSSLSSKLDNSVAGCCLLASLKLILLRLLWLWWRVWYIWCGWSCWIKLFLSNSNFYCFLGKIMWIFILSFKITLLLMNWRWSLLNLLISTTILMRFFLVTWRRSLPNCLLSWSVSSWWSGDLSWICWYLWRGSSWWTGGDLYDHDSQLLLLFFPTF